MAFDRRSLLIGSSLGGAALALSCEGTNASTEPSSKDPSNKGRTKDATKLTSSKDAQQSRLQTLVAVADRIVPPEPGRVAPANLGAKALGAAVYFEHILADKRLAQLRRPLGRGASFLNRGAKLESKVESFSDLPVVEQDAWLDRLNRDKVRPNGIKGSQFMRLMTALTLEACLCDPRHGGNREGAAWRWLNYSDLGRGGMPT